MVFLPTGTGNYRWIGGLEISWKVIKLIIDQRIASKVKFHDALHGFWANQSTVTACIEEKLLLVNWLTKVQVPGLTNRFDKIFKGFNLENNKTTTPKIHM